MSPKQEDGAEAHPTSAPTSARARRVWWVVGIFSVLMAAATAWIQGSGKPPRAIPAKSEPQPTTVVAVEVELGTIPLIARYHGELVANVAEVAAYATGTLTEVKVNLGDEFQKGEVLARVEATETSRQLSEAQAQVETAAAEKLRATAELEAAQVEAERGELLLKERVLSPQELSALRAKVQVLQAERQAAEAGHRAALARVELYRTQLARAALTAPFDGAVALRYLDPGSLVQSGTRVLRLVQSGPLEVRFRASEFTLNRLVAGTELEVTTLATGKKTFIGRLTRISAEVDKADRSVAAEGTLSEVIPELRPGMSAEVTVKLGQLEQARLIPEGALLSRVQPDGTPERGVFIIEGDRARYQAVEVVGTFGGRAAISGVELGARIVSEGSGQLSNGSPVRASQVRTSTSQNDP